MCSSPGIGIAHIYYGLKTSGQDPRNQSGFWLGKEAMRECFQTYIVGAPVKKAFSQTAGLLRGKRKRALTFPTGQKRDFVLTVLCLKPCEPQEQRQKAQHGLMSWMAAEWWPLACLQDGWGARGGASGPRTLQEAGGWESPGSRLRMLCALQ